MKRISLGVFCILLILFAFIFIKMYNAIISCMKNFVLDKDFVAIIPNGTAIQNARTSYIGDNLCRDQYCHLTYDFGRYIAGLTMVATITGADISKVTYTPGISEQYRQIAIESVVNALAKQLVKLQNDGKKKID